MSATSLGLLATLMSIAAGLIRVPFVHFLVIGTAGRLLRFAAIVLFPQVIRNFF